MTDLMMRRRAHRPATATQGTPYSDSDSGAQAAPAVRAHAAVPVCISDPVMMRRRTHHPETATKSTPYSDSDSGAQAAPAVRGHAAVSECISDPVGAPQAAPTVNVHAARRATVTLTFRAVCYVLSFCPVNFINKSCE